MSENTTATVETADATAQEGVETVQTERRRFLSPKEIIAFCLVHFGDRNLQEFFNNNMQYFMVQFFKVKPETYANLSFATGIYDIFDDTISGLVIDRTRTRWGRVKPYLLLPLPLLIIATLMVFSAPSFGDTGKAVWTGASMLLKGLGFSYFGAWYLILYNNTPNVIERNNLVTSSEFARLFSTWIISFISVFLDLGKSVGIPETKVYRGFALISIAILVSTCVYGFFNMRERIPLQSREEMNEVGIIESFKQILKNRPMFVLVLGNFFNSFKSVGSGNEKFFWFNCTGKYSYATIAGIFTGMPNYITTPMAGKFINKFGAKKTIIGAGLFGFVAYTAMFLIGYHPFGETFGANPVPNLIYMIIALTICGLPNCFIHVALPCIAGDVYDYSEWKTGVRNEALVNTIRGYFEKLGYNVNGWLAGMVLTWIHYVPMTDNLGNGIPSTDAGVLKGLWIIFALAPAAARLLTALAFFLFNVDGKLKEQMLIELAGCRSIRLKAMEEAEANIEK